MLSADSPKSPYCLVTGASSGIGRAVALKFASLGYGIVAVGRDQSALEKLATECKGVRICPQDLGDVAAAEKIERFLLDEKLTVQVLVNNAGFGLHGDFESAPLDKELEMVQVQIQALLGLTKRILPQIRATNGSSLPRGILNIASVYSYCPVPHQSVYGACKAFILSFTQALRNELGEDSGIHVTTSCPGVTQTGFRSRAGMREKKKTSGFTSEAVAEIAVRDFVRNRAISIPGRINKIFTVIMRLLPQAWVSGLMRRINRVRGISR